MTPTLAYGKAGRKYRYYVSQPLQLGQGKSLGGDVVRRVAAGAIEGLVMNSLGDCGLVDPSEGWKGIRQTVDRVVLGSNHVTITLSDGERFSEAALAAIRSRLAEDQTLVRMGSRKPLLELTLPGRPVFRGGRTWLASPDGRSLSSGATPNRALVQALRRAHKVVRDHGIAPGAQGADMHQGARSIHAPYDRALSRLAYLAPDLQDAIFAGKQPAGLTLEDLLKISDPLDWSKQRRAFGLPLP